MRVRGTGGTTGPEGSKPARRSAGGFALGGTASPAAGPAAPGPASAERAGAVAATFLDAAEVLRGLDRRKAAMESGRRSLDRLRELQAAILAGRIEPGLARRLAALAREPRIAVDDPGLQGVLDEIALRVDLELKRIARGHGHAKRRGRV